MIILKSPIYSSWSQYEIKSTADISVAIRPTKTGEMLVFESIDGKLKLALDPELDINELVKLFNMVNIAIYPN